MMLPRITCHARVLHRMRSFPRPRLPQLVDPDRDESGNQQRKFRLNCLRRPLGHAVAGNARFGITVLFIPRFADCGPLNPISWTDPLLHAELEMRMHGNEVSPSVTGFRLRQGHCAHWCRDRHPNEGRNTATL